MASRAEKRAQGRDLQRRLLALAGLAVIVGTAIGVLLVSGLLGGPSGVQAVTLLDPPPAPGHPGLEVAPEVGKLAPDFQISDFNGKRHRLSDFRGKPVYLNFWATWCVPCQVELSDIQELQDHHQIELVVLTINRREPANRARNFFRNLPNNQGGNGVSFTVNGLDPDDTLYNKYRGLGMPVSIFIDAGGAITRVRNGLIRLPQMEEAVAEALASAPAAGS